MKERQRNSRGTRRSKKHAHTHTSLKWDDCSSFKNRAIYDAIGRGSRRLFNYLVKLLRRLEERYRHAREGETKQWSFFFFVKVVFEKGRLAVGRIFWRMGERRYREISRSSVLNFLQGKCKCWIEEEMSWDNVREKYENPPLRWDFWMKNMKKGRGRGRVVEMLEDVQLEYVKVRRVWIGRGDEEILIVVKKGREEDFFRFLD